MVNRITGDTSHYLCLVQVYTDIISSIDTCVLYSFLTKQYQRCGKLSHTRLSIAQSRRPIGGFDKNTVHMR